MKNPTKLNFISLLISFAVISLLSYLMINPYFKKVTFLIIELFFVGLSFPFLCYLNNVSKTLFYVHSCILGYVLGLFSYVSYWVFFDLGFRRFLNEVGKNYNLIFPGIFLYSIFSFCFLILPVAVFFAKRLVKFHLGTKSSSSN